MRIIALLVFSFIVSNCLAQFKSPESVSISYFGELLTHPGLKLSADFKIKEWDKIKRKKNDSKTIQKSLLLGPTLGFFYHKRYQTGLFMLPEAKFRKQNPSGRFFECGIGLGYLSTFIPNTYQVNSVEAVNKTISGHHYFATNYFIVFGKELTSKTNLPVACFVKPQFTYAIPNFPNGAGYFALELGITYNLNELK